MNNQEFIKWWLTVNNREFVKWMVEVNLILIKEYGKKATIFEPCWELYYAEGHDPSIAVIREAEKQGWKKSPLTD